LTVLDFRRMPRCHVATNWTTASDTLNFPYPLGVLPREKNLGGRSDRIPFLTEGSGAPAASIEKRKSLEGVETFRVGYRTQLHCHPRQRSVDGRISPPCGIGVFLVCKAGFQTSPRGFRLSPNAEKIIVGISSTFMFVTW
jgi:hypothetical protein